MHKTQKTEGLEKLQGKSKNKVIPKTLEDLELSPNNFYSGQCMA